LVWRLLAWVCVDRDSSAVLLLSRLSLLLFLLLQLLLVDGSFGGAGVLAALK
jgi:hypothetical protein